MALAVLHALLYAGFSVAGWIDPWGLLNLILLAAAGLAVLLSRAKKSGLLFTCGLIVLIMGHTFVGQRVAPDALTSGAILMVSVLVLYVGIKINENLPARHWIVFVLSYLALYGIFILRLDNAEPLFVVFLIMMTACARSLRLMTYFWAATIGLTFCQPYAWAVILSAFFVIAAVHGARGGAAGALARVFLFAGLALVFLVLFPVTVVITEGDWHNMEKLLHDPRILAAIRMTAMTATVSTAILAVFVVPLAYALSRLRFRGRALLLSLTDLPIVIPQSAAGIAILRVFGQRQLLGGWFTDLFGVPVDGTAVGICLAQVFVALPFMLRSAVAAFDAVDPEMELTALTLGAGPWSMFRRIPLKLAARGIFLGAVLAWARAAGEFGAVVLVAPVPETAPVTAFNRYNSVGIEEVAPLISLLLLFSLAMFLLLQLVSRTLPTAHRGKEGA
jgi:molybdate/tungstate transport system permease protein